jgi:hypothetical protein
VRVCVCACVRACVQDDAELCTGALALVAQGIDEANENSPRWSMVRFSIGFIGIVMQQASLPVFARFVQRCVCVRVCVCVCVLASAPPSRNDAMCSGVCASLAVSRLSYCARARACDGDGPQLLPPEAA